MRPVRLTPQDIEDMRRLRRSGYKIREIAEYIGCHRSTVAIYISGIKRPKKPRSPALQSKLYRERLKADPKRKALYDAKARERARLRRLALRTQNLAEAAE